MTIRQSLLGQAVVGIGMAVYSASVKSGLPDTVPIHWNAAGKADGFGSPAINLWMMPGMIGFIMLLTWALPKLSPKKFEIDRFEHTYSMLMLVVAAMLAAMHVVIVGGMRGSHFDMTRAMMAIMGAFFAVFGNVMGKVRRNFYMGIRTPWTLASEPVWEATHRQAGALWFVGGILIAVLALAGVSFWILMTLLMIIALWPVVNSYLLYRRLEG